MRLRPQSQTQLGRRATLTETARPQRIFQTPRDLLPSFQSMPREIPFPEPQSLRDLVSCCLWLTFPSPLPFCPWRRQGLFSARSESAGASAHPPAARRFTFHPSTSTTGFALPKSRVLYRAVISALPP